MAEQLAPIPCANRINKLLDMFHAVDRSKRFPVDVEWLAQEIPTTFETGAPISVQGQALDPEFEGALFNLNADEPGPGHWAIIYNEAITSEGRIRFTLAHELGHYLLHRNRQSAFNCSEADMLHWDSEAKQLEAQADLFASYLLMPMDDFREQLQEQTVDLDVLGLCAERYGVSLTAAILKWLEFTTERAVLVVSQGDKIQWARSSKSAVLSKASFKRMPKGGHHPLPAQSATALYQFMTVDKAGVEIDARVWFPREPAWMKLREMKIVSDQYQLTMTLLILPTALTTWEREQDNDGLENTHDRFIRKGQLPVRS